MYSHQPDLFRMMASELFSAGRLSKPQSKLLLELNEKPRLEWEVEHLSAVLRVDYAHVVMLAEEDLLDGAHAGAILRELDKIEEAGPSDFSTEPGFGSIVLQIERILAQRLGVDIAGHLPIARSRLDQGAVVRRLVDRDNALRVLRGLLGLHETLTQVAELHQNTVMINYTHLQQAQPATFGHYLLAFKDRLLDSFDQLCEVYKRIDRNPLGAVGLSGTDLPINRQRTTCLLGFSQILDNSRLGRDGYYQIEIAFCLALMMTILNDLCTDLHIFSSTEFGTIELDDAHCSTSTIFPQKKNPYALEAIKGKAAEAQGWVATALALFRNEGTGDHANRTVGFLGTACVVSEKAILLTLEILQGMKVNETRYETLLSSAWVTTNRLGNILFTKYQLNYRTAHGVIARLVKNCLQDDISKSNVSIEMLQRAAEEMGVGAFPMGQEELTASLDHTEFIKSCNSFGSVGPIEVQRLLAKSREEQEQNRKWIAEKVNYIRAAEDELNEAKMRIKQAT